MQDFEKLQQFVKGVAASKTLIETIGEHKAESCTSYEIAEDLNKKSDVLDGFILKARELLAQHTKSATKPARFKCTDRYGGVAYIHKLRESYVCTLSNGVGAAFSYAVGTCDETALKFRLEDAESDNERLLILRSIGGPSQTKVEIVQF